MKKKGKEIQRGKGYLGFMDHSPSEQLLGKPNEWHSTAIVMSEGNETNILAKKIVKDLGHAYDGLKKWSNAKRGNYHRNFQKSLIKHLPQSDVYVFAHSAKEESILKNKNHVINELGLSSFYEEKENNKNSLESIIGPLKNKKDGEDVFFRFPTNRAIMTLWIAHFALRMHNYLLNIEKIKAPNIERMDWFLYIDKFAGDNIHESKGTALFSGAVNNHLRLNNTGNIRVSFFHESDTDNCDLFADNIAGLINSAKKNQNETILELLFETKQIYYESST